MADPGRLTLTVVTPERSVVERVPCDAVSLPGELGELGILPGHTPLVALLGVGRVAFTEGGKKTAVAVRGGFVEVAGDAVRVLADVAAAKDVVDATEARREQAEAEGRRLLVVGQEQLDAVNADVAFAEAKVAVAQGADAVADEPSGGKVREAFDAVHRDLGDRLGAEEKAAVDRLRDAAAEGDAARAREELAAVKERHGWLYEELVKHPRLAAIVDELALWGF